MRLTDKKAIFFDLDHTIWDFDKNAEETLAELFVQYKFEHLGFASFDVFAEAYTRNNQRLWAEYHNGKIDRNHLRTARFSDTFTELGVDPSLFPARFEADFVHICPRKPHLFPHAHETLGYLAEKFELHLISNGFRETSETKIASSGIGKYFKTIVLSDAVGVHKPHPRIFQFALAQAQAEVEESVMIGDSLEADILGAQGVGMDAIFFNPHDREVPNYVSKAIRNLAELQEIF